MSFRSWGLLLAAIALLPGAAVAASWEVTVGTDPFSDQPIATAEVASDDGDHLSITCDENKELVTVFSPVREIRAEEFEVRYRVDDNPPVASTLEWSGLNGRARAVVVSTKSLFGDRSQADHVDEFRVFGRQLIAGSKLVIEAGGEFAEFGLARSGAAMEAVLSACEVTLDPPAESG